MKRTLFSILLLFTVITLSFADGIKLVAKAKRAVTKGEQFRLTYELNSKGSGFKVPNLKDFDVLMGPSTSSSSNIQVINGQMTKSSIYTYTYILQAKKEGKFNIGSASIKVGDKTYTSNALTIEVVKSNNSNANSGNKSNSNSSGVSGKDLYVRLHVSRSNLYKGEYLIATIKVYTKLNLAGFNDMTFPSYDGFWTEDIPNPSQIQLVRENVNGEVYNVGVISQTILYPQKSGELYINPYKLECIVQKRVQNAGRGFFNNFFGGYKNYSVKVESPKVKINVKALPGNAPGNFAGAVGSYKLETSIDKSEVKTNDPINYKIKIKGSGNLKLIDPPEVKFPADFEVYDPNIADNINNNAAGSSGSKNIDYLIIPRHAGSFKINPISFTYFDVNSKTYKTLTSEGFNIKVAKGDDEDNATVVSNFSKENVKYIGKDIRFIKTNNINLNKKGEYIFGSLKFTLAYIISLLLFILIVIWKRKQIKQRANLALIKNKKANSTARKRLKLASKYQKENNKELFYDEIAKALWGYLSDKLSIPLAELTKDNVSVALQNKNIDENMINTFLDVLNVCEYARYAPAEGNSQMENVYNDAVKIISDIEQKINKQ